MSDVESTQESGSWRKGEFVRWQDLFVPLEAILVWIGLAGIAIAAAMSMNRHTGHSNSVLLYFLSNPGKDFVGKQIMLISMDLVVLFFVWRVARRVCDGAMVARYRSVEWTAILFALLGGVILAVATMVVNVQLMRHSIVTFHETPGERSMLPQSPANLPLGLLSIALVAPFVEEFYFRGILLSWLKRKMFVPLAAVISAVLFALVHFRFVSHPGADGWVYTGMIATVGLVNATLALRFRSLWEPFAVHAAHNATLVSTAALLPLFWQ
ncbi:MAG TPA: CPBP family intramembrane glutamic endopeptidase [Rhizomicrobium sp.]|nr:CPBP family intramembrane glutamic endopeptidase [Rhizomicrobium sp.]